MSFKSLKSARTLTRHIGSAALAAAICAAVAPSPSQAEKPDYFVEYAEPSAYLYVDTGIIGKSGTRVQIRAANFGGGDILIGARHTDSVRFEPVNFWGEQSGMKYANNSYHQTVFSPYYGDWIYDHAVSSAGVLTATVTDCGAGGNNGSTSHDWGTAINTETTMYIFGSHYRSDTEDKPVDQNLRRVYYCKIWQEDGNGGWTLVRDLKPCVKDGVVGFYDAATGYDALNGTVFYPQGGGLLKGGNLVYDTIATWNGGATPTSNDLATAANWNCTDANGTAIASVVPGKTALAVLPSGITLPSGYEVPWAATKVAGTLTHPVTLWGREAFSGDRKSYSNGGVRSWQWRDDGLQHYVARGEGDVSYINQNNSKPVELQHAQFRYDGWFNVSAEQAGEWALSQAFDDYFGLCIDGNWVLSYNSFSGGQNTTWTATAGWHRFTMIAGDTWGGWGAQKDVNGTPVPFTIATPNYNSGATFKFSDLEFGSGTNTITLSANADWSALGTLALSDGTVIDLNGCQLTIKDAIVDGYIGAKFVNSNSKKAVLLFTGEPSASTASKYGLIDGVGTKILLAKAGEQSATWTGAANNGNALDANNWEDTLTGEAVVPTANYAVTIVGTAVNVQIPSGSTFACKSFEIGNCTFTTNCDWRGLSKTPVITGTANLNGHVLKLNNLSAAVGSVLSGGEGSTVTFDAADASYGTFSEATFIDNFSSLTKSGSVKILFPKTGSGTLTASTALNIGTTSGGSAEFYQTDGTVALAKCGISTVAGGSAIYAMSNGTLTASSDFEIGGRGVGEFIQTGGTATLAGWLNLGRYGGTGTLTVNGGRMVNTYNKEVYVGAEGGTGIINVGGNGYLEVYNLPVGAWNVNNTKGYVNISGNGHLKARNWAALCNNNSSRTGMWGEVNQSGGTFEISTDFAIGERSTGTGVYNLTGGDLTVRLMQIGWNSGSVGRMTMSGGTATTSSDFYVGRDGTGTFNLSGGDMTVGALTRIAWGSGGVGTMTMDGGTFTVNGDQLLVADWGKGTFTQNAGTVTVTKASAYVGIGQSSGSVGTYTLNGGTLVTPQVKRGAGKGTLILNGGTIVATNVTDGANFISGLDNMTYGPGGLTLDSAGYNVTMVAASGANVVASDASTFTKTGDGTLTVAAVPPVGNIVVSNGTLALSASCDNTAPVGIAHRWSFTSDLTDSVTGTAGDATASAGVTYSDGKASLTGGDKGTCYINLGANKLPSDSVTLEFWTTITTRKVWTKMFCLGKDTGSCLAFTFNRNSDAGVPGLDVAPNGGTYTGTGTLDANTPYYLAFTLKPNASGGTEVKGYCYNATTGALVGSLTQTVANWSLIDKIIQQSFCLGYSFWNDSDAYADYDEVRVWSGALSADAIALSATKGPDATADDIAEIAAATSAATPVERTLSLESGATLSIGAGNTLTQPVVTGSGMVAGGTLVVSDKVLVKCGETLTASGTIDLTNAKAELVDPENLTTGFYFIKAAPGATLSIVGKPEAVYLPKGWRISVTSSGAKIQKVGFTVILR